MKKNQDSSSVVGKGVLLPAALAGAGMFTGSLVGGTAARALSRTPGMRQKLSRMSPAQKKVLLNRIAGITTALGGAAGAGVSGLSYGLMRKELDKKEKAMSKSAMYAGFFDELRRIV